MPSSSKRPQRTRREPLRKNDIPDSSPSRPAKRRKKVEEPAEEPIPESEPIISLPLDRSGVELDDEDLIAAVVPFLQIPSFPVQATQDHANKLHEKHYREGVQAYAKLSGKDWTFYIKQLKNLIGRPPEGSVHDPVVPNVVDAVSSDTQEEGGVQINLGPNKVVSREHANIYFDVDTESWNIEVLGRNGIRLNNDTLRRNAKVILVSGQVIEIGGVEMMFVLPDRDAPLEIHDKFLARAQLIAENEKHNLPSQPAPVLLPTPPRAQNGIPGALPIAPAPPNYQRPGTPLGMYSKNPHSAMKSPAYAGGTIFMNSDNVDLSRDETSQIKPTFSYANLISQAILNNPEEKINLAGIYSFITDRYSYYRHQPPGGWQNSIRHNLSLNKAFVKVPRSTDEPGKGMKWCIVPESRDEMVRNCAKGGRGGHRGSSIPNSPANIESFRVSKDSVAPSSGPRKRSPPSGSPGFPYTAPQLTPDRRKYLSQSLDDSPGDGSPLPRHKPSRGNFGLSDNLPGSPPPLSSSYMQDESNSFVTPAPHRVHPRLAPPSTAQRPSQVMPTSSPAPFWRYADIGNTPMKSNFIDSSPVKGAAPSSSPPQLRRTLAASPTRNPSPPKIELPSLDEIEEEDNGFDLTRGFQSISSFHASTGSNVAVSNSNISGRS